MTTLIPYLTFRNGAASVEFLVDGLGFDIVTEQRSVDDDVVHVELRRRDAAIMGGDGRHRPNATPGLYIVDDNVDELFDQAVRAGATVVYPPEDTEWGTRRARLQDLDGNEWSIGTYHPTRPGPMARSIWSGTISFGRKNNFPLQNAVPSPAPRGRRRRRYRRLSDALGAVVARGTGCAFADTHPDWREHPGPAHPGCT